MRPLLACLVAALALTACTARQTGGSAGNGFVAGDGSAAVTPVDQRQPAPAVSGDTVGGESLDLASLDGVVVLNFWASWCGPCVDEAPALENINKAYAEDVHVVGVNIRDTVTAARNFQQNFDLTYPSLYDEPAAIAAAFGGIGPAALPTTIILDDEHRVAVRLFGEVDEGQLSVYLDELLAEADSPREVSAGDG